MTTILTNITNDTQRSQLNLKKVNIKDKRVIENTVLAKNLSVDSPTFKARLVTQASTRWCYMIHIYTEITELLPHTVNPRN